MKNYLIVFLFLCQNLFGQDKTCGTVQSQNFRTYPSRDIASRIEDNEIFRIPIIVHVLHNGENIGEGTNISMEQIYSQIDVINEDFNLKNTDKDNTIAIFKDRATAANIRFIPAIISPNGDYLKEIGINRIKVDKLTFKTAELEEVYIPKYIWNTKNYLNIFIVGNIVENIGFITHFPDKTGLPGLPEINKNAEIDAIVVEYNRFGSYNKFKAKQLENIANNLGRTLTHEIGHFLGLLHTFSEIGNCQEADFCEDTPYTDIRNFTCNPNLVRCGNVVMTQNFMDYTTDRCMSLFTKKQVERMRQAMRNSPQRNVLNQSPVLNPKNEISIQIYPNPVQNILRVNSFGLLKLDKYYIYNYIGQEIDANTLQNNEINISGLVKGVYLLKIEDESKNVFVKKFIVF